MFLDQTLMMKQNMKQTINKTNKLNKQLKIYINHNKNKCYFFLLIFYFGVVNTTDLVFICLLFVKCIQVNAL